MAEVTTETTLQEVKEYQYFQPELIEIIASENIYEEDSPGGRPPWEIVEYAATHIPIPLSTLNLFLL